MSGEVTAVTSISFSIFVSGKHLHILVGSPPFRRGGDGFNSKCSDFQFAGCRFGGFLGHDCLRRSINSASGVAAATTRSEGAMSRLT